DLAKCLAQIELAESFVDESFSIWRQTRTGLLSYPLGVPQARAHLAQSVMLQMSVKPHIIHVVGYTEADHAATADEVIESAQMAGYVAEVALRGSPDMTADPVVQERKEELIAETHVLLDAIRALSPDLDDPLTDPATLARAVKIGLLDAPQLVNNPYAPGAIRTRSIDGAIRAVDEQGRPLTERERIDRVLARAEVMEQGKRQSRWISQGHSMLCPYRYLPVKETPRMYTGRRHRHLLIYQGRGRPQTCPYLRYVVGRKSYPPACYTRSTGIT